MKSAKALMGTLALAGLAGSTMAASPPRPVHNIVLVHGAFADGSGWKAIAEILEKDGYNVSVVQEPETSLADDVRATKLVLGRQSGPTVLVGHSYGGAVITEAGNDPHVVSLVYVAGFAPDQGQTLKQLSMSMPAEAGKDIKAIGGFTFVDPAKFPYDFAADVPLHLAKFMAISQVGQSVSSAMVKMTKPAWKTRPTYAIVASQDRMINPDLERAMYKRAKANVTELPGNHAIYVSQPEAVAEVIERAAGKDH